MCHLKFLILWWGKNKRNVRAVYIFWMSCTRLPCTCVNWNRITYPFDTCLSVHFEWWFSRLSRQRLDFLLAWRQSIETFIVRISPKDSFAFSFHRYERQGNPIKTFLMENFSPWDISIKLFNFVLVEKWL